MKKLCFLLLLFICPVFIIQSKAQSNQTEDNNSKKVQKPVDAKEKKSIEAGIKRHQKIQTKKTRENNLKNAFVKFGKKNNYYISLPASKSDVNLTQ